MMIGKPSVPLPFALDPLSSTAITHPPADQLQRMLSASLDRLNFQAQQGEVSASVRERVLTNGRSGLYQALASDLSALAASLQAPQALALGGSNGLKGPDAKLSELAPQLGLASSGGRYAIALDGQQFSFGESQTLNDVLTTINSRQSGIEATFDPTAQRVIVRQLRENAAPIVASDVQGNLISALGLTPAQQAPSADSGNLAAFFAQRLQTLVPQTTAAIAGPAVASFDVATSRSVLALGTSAASGTGSGSVRLDPNAVLATQPLATPITQGFVSLAVTANGGSQRFDVFVDPNRDSLNDVLSKFNQLRINSSPFVNAAFDATTGQVNFQFNSSGPSFDANFLGAQGGLAFSNFFNVVTNNAPTANLSVVAGATVAAGRRGSTYDNLAVTLNGSTYQASGLILLGRPTPASSAASQLATQVNTQFAITGPALSATAASGSLTLVAATQALGANPNLQVSVRETPVRSSLAEGFNAPSTTVKASLSGSPALAARAIGAGTLGPDATLAQLASQLGLVPQNGQYRITVNGTPLAFTADQSLNDVLAGINRSQAGVTASYDPVGRRIVVRDTVAGAATLDLQDVTGNLIQRLGLARTPSLQVQGAAAAQSAVTNYAYVTQTSGTDAIRQLASGIDAALGLIDTAMSGAGPAFRNDTLLKNLASGLNGAFVPSSDGTLKTLGDLGLTRSNGVLQIDQSKLDQLVKDRPNDVQAFIGGYVQNTLGTLFQAGSRALRDDLAGAPLDQRLAQQAVAAHADIGRMQERQQLLLFQQVATERAQHAAKQQQQALAATQSQLEERQESRQQRLQETQAAAVARPPALATHALEGPGPGAGMLSFGLAN